MFKFFGEKERCVQFYGQVENLTRNCKELCESLHALISILSVKLGPFLAPILYRQTTLGRLSTI